MGTIWKLIRNWRKVANTIAEIAEVAKDKKVTDEEVRQVVDSILPLAIELGLVKED
jgi:hypothetical protein